MNDYELREKIHASLKLHPRSMRDIALEIGLPLTTFYRFYVLHSNAYSMTRQRIENWAKGTELVCGCKQEQRDAVKYLMGLFKSWYKKVKERR